MTTPRFLLTQDDACDFGEIEDLSSPPVVKNLVLRNPTPAFIRVETQLQDFIVSRQVDDVLIRVPN